MPEPTRIVVVDESAIFRRLLCKTIDSIPNTKIVGQTGNGITALELIDSLKPDLVLLDIELSGMDGYQILHALQRFPNHPGVIMLTTAQESSVRQTTKALQHGAFDFILKPCYMDAAENQRALRRKAYQCLQAFAGRTRALNTKSPRPTFWEPLAKTAGEIGASWRSNTAASFASSDSIVVMGVSTGGPAVLHQTLGSLPSDFPAPILIVQHMPPRFTRSLAADLNQICPLDVREAKPDEPISSGMVRIAQGGRQLRLAANGYSRWLEVVDSAPVQFRCPSVDYLFDSASQHVGENTIGVIMSGMGRDGLEGCRKVKQRGGKIFTQSPETCVVSQMSRSIRDQGLSDHEFRPQDFTQAILQQLRAHQTA